MDGSVVPLAEAKPQDIGDGTIRAGKRPTLNLLGADVPAGPCAHGGRQIQPGQILERRPLEGRMASPHLINGRPMSLPIRDPDNQRSRAGMIKQGPRYGQPLYAREGGFKIKCMATPPKRYGRLVASPKPNGGSRL